MENKVALITIALVALVAVGGIASLNLGGSSGAVTVDEAAKMGYQKGVDCAKGGVNTRGCCSQSCITEYVAACERMCLLRVAELQQ